MIDLIPVRSNLLAGVEGLAHGFFTRRGGVSVGVYESLNVGHATADLPDHVEDNRRRVEAWLGLDRDGLRQCNQIHSAAALLASAVSPGSRPDGDALVMSGTGTGVGVLTADCAPVLLVDPQTRIAAAAHAGWRGAVGGILEATVDLMISQGAQASRIVAAVGPCISQQSYEVGDDFSGPFLLQDAGNEQFFDRHAVSGRLHFDLPGYALHRLARLGIEQAEWTGEDTCSDAIRFFSNRRAVRHGEADFGRQISALTLSV